MSPRSISPSAISRAVTRLGLVAIWWILGSCFAAAQSGLNLSGYLEHQYSLTWQDEEWTHIDYDRLRLDVNASAGKRTRASAGLIWQLYRGNTTFDLSRQVPPNIASQFAGYTYSLSNTTFLNHAYLSFRPGKLEVIVGKQYMNWGASWVFNPTELFRPKNVFEPSYDREGVGALVIKMPLGSMSDVMVGIVPNGDLAESGKVIRLRAPVGSLDFSALAAVLHDDIPQLPGLPAASGNQRLTFGGDLSGELGNVGFWAEGTWSDRDNKQWIEATIGGNHSLADGTLFLLEILYNSRGDWESPYEPTAWMSRFGRDLRSLGRLTSYTMVSRRIGQLWNIAGSLIANPSDKSGVVVPAISYDFAQDVQLTLIGLVYFGSENDEYGRKQYGGYIRGRVYF